MQKLVMVVVILFASVTLPLVATPVWAKGGHVPTFVRTYSGPGAGFVAGSVQQTTDGGYIVAGFTITSISPPPLPILGQTWLVRLDSTGAVIWQKEYGPITGVNLFFLPHAVQTPDGGFVVETYANVSSTVTAVLVFKVDGTGSLVWQEAFTGTGEAMGSSIDLASDGGVVVAGFNLGPSGPLTALVLKLNSTTGGLIWEKTYSGLGVSAAASVGQTSDGGFIVAGATNTAFSPSSFGGPGWLLRLDSGGNIVWQNTYTTTQGGLFSARQTSDGGFIAAGIIPPGPPATALVLRVDSAGAVLWERSIGNDFPLSVEQTSDGGFVVAGILGFPSSSLSAVSGSVVRLDSSGSIVWQKVFSGLSGAFSVEQTSDGGFVVAGDSVSTLTPPLVPSALVFKLNSKGQMHHCTDISSSSLTASTFSAPATVVTGGSPVDITATSPGTPTTFASKDTSAFSTVICQGH